MKYQPAARPRCVKIVERIGLRQRVVTPAPAPSGRQIHVERSPTYARGDDGLRGTPPGEAQQVVGYL
ncbi:MAG: hypothetical protein ACP5H5_07940 [Pyrobaculum sp.]